MSAFQPWSRFPLAFIRHKSASYSVKFRWLWRHACGVAAACFILPVAAPAAPAKPIRLRNQIILPGPSNAAPAAAKSAPASPVSRLLLIQFHEPPSPETRAQLAAAGAELLHYLPQDAFIARCRNVRPDLLRKLPSVEWVGDYRPEYRIHQSLRAKVKAQPAAEPLAVAVLLAPGATAAEKAAVRRAFSADSRQSTLRLGTVLRGTITGGQLEGLARSDSVLWIEPLRPMKLFDEVSSKIVAGDGGQNTLLTQSLGYDGAGVKVAVADSGLNKGDAATMHPDLLGRTPAFFYYGTNLTSAADEHSHGTHVAGIIAGNGATGEVDENGALYGLGVAPAASIVAQRIFDADGNYEAPTNGFPELTQDATDAGAVIGSNSWGDDTQGNYDLSAMEFDELVRDATGSGTNDRPYILEFSAGNAGPAAQTVGSPAVAKNVIATGACESDRPDYFIYADGPHAMADFSSRGPCEDGRIKPDLVAPGTWISSLQSASASDQYAWLPIDSYYQFQGGTSQAGPHASGAAAVFVQYYRQTHTNATPSPALVKAALINSATDMDDAYGTGPVPNMDEGWGRVDLTPIFDSPLTFDFLDQSVLMTNGQVFERHLLVASADEPLKVTLAYTDVPGFPGAVPALVNDLDLEVVGPDGELYRGNQFNNGESIPNPSGPDTVNNVEAVHLTAPQPGDYTIRVRARSIVQDVLAATNLLRQDFALVTSGLVPAPGTSAISLDRRVYTAPSQIRITVIDSDQAGQASITVLARSTAETNGETILLAPAGVGGSFTGAIATATGPAIPDGRLQIANSNDLQVSYFDASVGSERIATARADLDPPALRAVYAANSFGQAVVSWVTDEPATSIVRYGTNQAVASLTLAVTNVDLTAEHSIWLPGLVANRTYYYYVVSEDEAGNLATNSNGGALFSFVAAPTAPVLLVDEYVDDPYVGDATPLSGYTNALDLAGINYDVWLVSDRGEPTNVLQSYRAVIWRVQEMAYVVPRLWSQAERAAISNYLHHGGSLFVASMEVLTWLDLADPGFRRNVLHVQSFLDDEHGSTYAARIIGSPYETVGHGIDIAMDYTPYDIVWGGYVGPDISDTITPANDATAVLRNDAGDIVGLRWPAVGQQGSGRLVFFSFAFDAVPINTTSPGDNDQVALLRNVLSFLAPGYAGVATVTLDSPAYTLPSVVTVEVGDARLSGQGTVTVTATSTTQTNGPSVTLRETATQGVFLGSFQVISAANPPVSGKLRASTNDILRVAYFDAGSNAVVLATASIDTVPPSISGVAADPDYQAATISWTSSKPADSLVQFGESAFLDRSAYNSEFTTDHEVTLANLQPDRTNYYRVISRDLAGNTTTDDNQGRLYAFHTLVPLSAPWSDSMDTGAADWSVFNADYNDSEWTLGVPNNGLESSAHSPLDAWGSNLSGAPIGYAETFLISPAIYLPDGKIPTLHFWHSYGFSTESDLDIMEYGQVLLITNSDATAALTLATYEEDTTPGWEEQVLDLTPYAGKMIYLVWDYELLTFDDRRRPGWLVDDVFITVSNPPLGTILITNNLWQAAYSLSGPANLSRTGLGASLTNAPVGQYTLRFSPVPYYLTPPAQTNTLAVGGTLLFQGLYTFPDINTNGISDLWEQYFFGNLSTNRSLQDYAAFIAGTDPIGPPPSFSVSARLLSSALCRLSWPASPGQQYRLYFSTNLLTWQLYSTNWLHTNQFDLPIPAASQRSFFKIEADSALAPPLRLSLLGGTTNGPMTLVWPASIGRGYCVFGSTNGSSWAPVSTWFQATNTTLAYPLAAPAPSTRCFFRVQVQP